MKKNNESLKIKAMKVMETKLEFADAVLKNGKRIPLSSKIMAGAAIAPVVPVGIASIAAQAGIFIVGSAVELTGFALALPTNLLATGLYAKGEDCFEFGEFVFKGMAFVASLPGMAIDIVTKTATGILKLADYALKLATMAVVIPFKSCALAILNRGRNKINTDEKEENIIDIEADF